MTRALFLLLILGAGAVPASAAALSGTTTGNGAGLLGSAPTGFRERASQPVVVPLSAGLVPPLVALRGVATYFPSCHRCAAASGELQAALGPRWQGMTVRVVHGGRHVDVRLVTGCGCGPRPAGPTVIDLSTDAFQALVPGKSIASIGVLRVVVVAGNVPALPPTDMEDGLARLPVRGNPSRLSAEIGPATGDSSVPPFLLAASLLGFAAGVWKLEGKRP